MTQKLQFAVRVSAASVLTFSILAQTPSVAPGKGEQARTNRFSRARTGQLNGAAKAGEIAGLTVKNYQDLKLGKVEDLVVDVESGRIVAVIVSTGGFIGIGRTLTAVPPGALHYDIEQNALHLDADTAKMDDAPKFDLSKRDGSSEHDRLSAVYRHFGEEAAFQFVRKDGSGAVPPAGGNTEARADRTTTRNADGTWDKDPVADGSLSMIPMERLARLRNSSMLMGMPVKNLQDETLGKVENILVDLASGRLVALVVSSGGFLGIDGELSAIPPTALRVNAEGTGLQLDASKELLGKAPHFKADKWPDFAEPGYAAGFYRAFRVEPYFAPRMVSEADIDTALDGLARENLGLTPLDQGDTKADMEATTRIRKEIIAGKDMSVNARNVKIITRDGRVTLRGPVNSAGEKRAIGEIAERVASGFVDNQITVTPDAGNR